MWLAIEAIHPLRALGQSEFVALMLGRSDVAGGFTLRGWSPEPLRAELHHELG
jgi:hypothetical protein